MKSAVIGIIVIAAAVYAILPQGICGIEYSGLGWGQHVLNFLKGGVPVVAILLGIVAVFIGIADIKDRAEAKRESQDSDA
ncbi:MAG: hypothetical protein FWD28_01305 [Treponema sp.]|nr:hypothetical protein [Treponema sp.]